MSRELDQDYERDWWGHCGNTYGEEEKQLTYAKYMGLKFFHDGRSPYNIDLQRATVIDIGGGPVSLLLKCVNKGECMVIDPCLYPGWIGSRYEAAGIQYTQENGEYEFDLETDEVWCYNVLQHTIDPEKVVKNMRKYSKIIRVFEWVDTRKTLGHPHTLIRETLDRWLGGSGQVVDLNAPTLKGRAYYGVFKGDRYES